MAADVPHLEYVRYVEFSSLLFQYIVTYIMACISTAAARESSSVAATDGAWVDTDAAVPPGGRLVRVPIDELQLADIK
jgi:hypothetical protein